MKKLRLQLSGKITYLILVLLLLTTCQNSNNHSSLSLKNIPTFTPKELIRFDHAGDFYFSHLGYSSAVLEDGNILIPEKDNTGLVVVDSAGNLKKLIREGRGPGEILDVQYLTKDSDNKVYSYDQGNKKILVFDGTANLLNEFTPPTNRESSIERVFLMPDSSFLFELFSFAFLMQEDRDKEKILIQFDQSTNSYGNQITLKDQPYARLTQGATLVPYADVQLVEYHPQRKTLFLFYTGTNIIAEIDSDFDTLSTIQVDLPKEKLSGIELEKVKEDKGARFDEVKKYLPEYKSTAQAVKIFNNMIWLQSNLRGKYQKWFVLNMKGEIEQIVSLPKGSILTHISDHHLGVRLDDVTFALYKSVNS